MGDENLLAKMINSVDKNEPSLPGQAVGVYSLNPGKSLGRIVKDVSKTYLLK